MFPLVFRALHELLETLLAPNIIEESIALKQRIIDEAPIDCVLQPIERLLFGADEG